MVDEAQPIGPVGNFWIEAPQWTGTCVVRANDAVGPLVHLSGSPGAAISWAESMTRLGFACKIEMEAGTGLPTSTEKRAYEEGVRDGWDRAKREAATIIDAVIELWSKDPPGGIVTSPRGKLRHARSSILAMTIEEPPHAGHAQPPPDDSGPVG